MTKNLLASFILVITAMDAGAQPNTRGGGTSYASFIDYKKAFSRPAESLKKKEDTLQKQFEAKKLEWPAKYVYIRSFKYDSQHEVWVKNDPKDKYQLFKTYRVCALAGTLGPKR